MSLRDWAVTEGGNNTTLGVTLTEGATPFANMNNAARQIMADVRLEVASFGTAVAAASAPAIGIDGQAHTVTGTTTISSFATASAGIVRVLYFETATPVANSSTLELPGGATITSAKGDVAAFRSHGSGNWRCEWWTKKDGTAIVTSLDKTTSSAGTIATWTSTEAGATQGPDLVLDRNSASPADNDVLGSVVFNGRDDGGNSTTYAYIQALALDVTNATEDGGLRIRTISGGVDTATAQFGQGLIMAGVTGGFKGDGTINATGFYVNGSPAAGPVYIIQDQKSSGTNGGGLTSGSWVKRTLNTEVLDEITITTTTSTMALAAGTYKCWFWSTFYAVDLAQCRLQNTTNTVTLAIGNNIRAGAGNGGISAGAGYFVLSGAANVELQARVSTTNATDGGGQATSWGTEVYSTVYLEKVA